MLLPEKYRRLFSNKQIVCIEYMDINDRDEREIFQRVQLGMALTPAEKLAVIKSSRADFIRQLQSTFFKDSSSPFTTLAWDRSRGTDFRCLATILWCLDRFSQSPSFLANTGSIIQIESWLSAKQQSLSPQFKSDVTAGFSFLEAMLNSNDPTIMAPFNAIESGRETKVSPIEFPSRLHLAHEVVCQQHGRRHHPYAKSRQEWTCGRQNEYPCGRDDDYLYQGYDDDTSNDYDQANQASSNRKSSPVEVSRKRKRTGIEVADKNAVQYNCERDASRPSLLDLPLIALS